MRTNAAITIFAYNRPDCLRETLNALRENAEVADSDIFVFCDGPKSNANLIDLEKIKEVRRISNEITWCRNLKIVESNKNQGLGVSIINGVTEVLKSNEKIIVLEDDLVVSKHYLKFMNESLDLFKDNDEVISVSGYNYPLPFSEDFQETMFLRSAECLGWGTWKRGWDMFEKDAGELLNKIESNSEIYMFNFNNNYPYSKLLYNVKIGKANSWAIRWYATAFVNRKLTFYPKKSLVRHIGNNSGTNVKIDDIDLLGWEISNQPIKIENTPVVESDEFRTLLIKHLRRFNRKRLTFNSAKYLFKKIIFLFKELTK